MSSWDNLIRWCLLLFALTVFIAGGYKLATAKPADQKPCQDSSELRAATDSEFKCHPKAKLKVDWGGAIREGYVLDTCFCQQ